MANTYGGGMYNDSSSPILINCIFSGNSAQLGGGMGNYYEESSPALNNCIFSGNSAQLGGGIYNESSNPELTNCTFYGNSATADGGGIHNSDSTSPTLTNCILWSNGGTAKTAQIYNDINSAPVINYCCIQGWTTGGTGNIGDDPLFIDAAGGNLQLSVGSPCVDSGTDDGAPTEDIEGNPRPVDGNGDKVATTDMGAYESAFLSNFISVTSTPEGASFTISGAVSYSGTTPWNVNETLTGEYTIAWGDLGGYTKPSGETKELTDEGSISFEGDYIPITHDLTMAVSGNGTISPSVGSHTYNEGTVVNITAAPDSGWQFDSWTGNVDDTSSVNTTVTMNGNEAITANFIELTGVIYDLTIAVDGNGTTSPLKGSHTYNEGTVVNITANHDPGWQFDNWTGDVADPNSASTTVTIDGDKTVTANFTEETQDGETGGCCSCSSSDVSANELAIGWGIIGLCWGGGYYMVRRSRNRKI